MQTKLALILGLLLAVGFSQAKRWNTNKDSIVVDAQYSSEEDGHVFSDTVDEKAECYTSDGEAGECVTVIRCHPILFSEKGQLRNSGLAITYAETEDACASKNSVDGRAENITESGDSQISQKVICCAKGRIQYDLRSEMNQDVEEYTTTGVPSGEAVVPTTQQNIVVEDIAPTSNPSVYVEDDIVVVESDRSPASAEVETAVSTQTSVDVSEPEPEAVPEAVPEQPAAESAVTLPPSPVVPDDNIVSPAESSQVDQGVPEPEPEVQPEPAVEEPTSACSGKEGYGSWPVFQDYPWLATIQTKAKTGPTCSGSLITETHVLSAAHCIHRFNSRDVARMQIRIGFTKRSINDTFNDYYVLRNASKIIFHKRFHEQSKMDNNIALIKLDEPVEFDDHIAPIGVFNGLGGFDAGNCSAAEAGWIKFGNRKVTGISPGVIHYVEAPMSDFHLRESLSRVLNNEECNVQLNSQINEKMLCAKSTDFEEPTVSTDFFRWNDGGPLVVKVGNMIQQIGIKSWAYEGQQYPTVYTRVDSYLDWIRNNLKM